MKKLEKSVQQNHNQVKGYSKPNCLSVVLNANTPMPNDLMIAAKITLKPQAKNQLLAG